MVGQTERLSQSSGRANRVSLSIGCSIYWASQSQMLANFITIDYFISSYFNVLEWERESNFGPLSVIRSTRWLTGYAYQLIDNHSRPLCASS